MNQIMAMALDPSVLLRARGMQPDAWQREVLACQDKQILLNCTRQAGKTTVVASLALHQALFEKSDVLLISPGTRQSSELFHRLTETYNAIERPLKVTYETQLKMELSNGSRIFALPGKEATIRGYSPKLIVIDEAARVPDDLYYSVRPMLAVTKGRLVALSTPFGQRGWFYDEWTRPESKFKKVRITWKSVSRITKEFIEEEIKSMGQAWVNQEYECLFTALEGLVYPDFEKTYTDFYNPMGKPYGGIDWGWRNPFAAIWGVLDRDDVLWIQEERYLRETALHEHSKALPHGYIWYADPAGPTEINEFRVAGHKVRKGLNDIRLGVAAVTARIRTSRLKVNNIRCPNLIAESKLYRYPSQQERQLIGEKPVDEDNHALGALRYLISRLDGRFIAKLRKIAPTQSERIEEDILDEDETRQAVFAINRPKLIEQVDLRNEDLWTPL